MQESKRHKKSKHRDGSSDRKEKKHKSHKKCVLSLPSLSGHPQLSPSTPCAFSYQADPCLAALLPVAYGTFALSLPIARCTAHFAACR